MLSVYLKLQLFRSFFARCQEGDNETLPEFPISQKLQGTISKSDYKRALKVGQILTIPEPDIQTRFHYTNNPNKLQKEAT